ncbi:hypothetical protein L218DRAFT_958530 [Marasmius fiardii PR-910]|nr:hypothetical protein L218DRAFT_958530 [Marasmius fiardii PR-910]
MRPFTSIVILHALCLIYAAHIPRGPNTTTGRGLDQKRQIHNADYSTSQKPNMQKSDSNSTTTAAAESSSVHSSTEPSQEEHHKREAHRFFAPNETEPEMRYHRSRSSKKHIMQTAPVRSHPRSFRQHELWTRAIGSNKGTPMRLDRDVSHESSTSHASHSAASTPTSKQVEVFEGLANKLKRDATPASKDASAKFPDVPRAIPDSSELLTLPALAVKNSRRDASAKFPDVPRAIPDSSELLTLPALAVKNSRRDAPPASGPPKSPDAPPAAPVPTDVGELTKQVQVPASPQKPKRAIAQPSPASPLSLPIPVSTPSSQPSNSARNVLPQLKERRTLFKAVIARWFTADSPEKSRSIGTSKASQHVHPVLARKWLKKISRSKVV